MRTTTKLILGVATLWPLTAWLVLAVFIIWNVFRLRSFSEPEVLPVPQAQSPPSLGQLTPKEIALCLGFAGTAFLAIGLVAFYLRDVSKNPQMGEGTRARWSSAMFKYNVLVIPVYWYLYVWPRPTTGTVNATDMLIPAGTKNGVSKQWEHLVIEQLERGQWQLRLGTGILAIIVLAMVVWIVADGVTVDRCCALVFVVGLLLAFLFGGRAMRAAIRDIRIKKQEQHDTSSAQLRRQSE